MKFSKLVWNAVMWNIPGCKWKSILFSYLSSFLPPSAMILFRRKLKNVWGHIFIMFIHNLNSIQVFGFWWPYVTFFSYASAVRVVMPEYFKQTITQHLNFSLECSSEKIWRFHKAQGKYYCSWVAFKTWVSPFQGSLHCNGAVNRAISKYYSIEYCVYETRTHKNCVLFPKCVAICNVYLSMNFHAFSNNKEKIFSWLVASSPSSDSPPVAYTETLTQTEEIN